MENKQQAHEQKNEVSKKPSLLRNIFVVFMFVLASIGTSTAAYEFIFSNFIENIFISVALGILLGTGFMYFFITVIIGDKIIKK
ncbi:MAG: hypothetical protein FWB88_09535 [Defluviitaleaceae bacterium]|nr:hypothetical protein [Defluviitaleaceae bacterium]MCL2240874.1 hypothetical protein [Defluviitaleaceae bacterium]